MSASESVSIRPQKRLVDRPSPSEKSMAMDDVKNSEISKQIRIRTNIDLKCEKAICFNQKIRYINDFTYYAQNIRRILYFANMA